MPILSVTSARPKLWQWLALLSIVVSGTALYLPFFSNQLIFDDQRFFYSFALSHYAITPFDLAPRTFPYFTFAFIQAITQSFEIQRLFNLVLHCTNAYLIFLVCRMLLSLPSIASTDETAETANQSNLVCACIALAFILHPVAVYGTGYLVQRPILIATFFSLLSLLNLGKAIQSNAWPPIYWAALLSIGAMFSKEHSALLPVAAACLLFAIYPKPSTDRLIKTAAYLLLCLPAMLWLAYALRSAVATPYEIHAPIYLQSPGDALWLRSVLAESGLFFQYLRLWLLPDTSLMSIDLRVFFPESWSSSRALLGGGAFLLSFAGSAYCLLRTRRFRLIGFGLLYAQTLFLVELSTVRIQEPFALYRSYLWAPGFLIIALNLFQQFPRRLLTVVFALILPTLAYQSANRLESISTSLNAWQDAQAKLNDDRLPGAFRIYHNRGVQYLRAKQNDLALTDFVTCNRLNPTYAGCLSGQAQVLFRTKKYEQALVAIDSALQLDPTAAALWESKGKIHEALGQRNRAETAYAEAVARGGSLATFLRQGKLAQPASTKTIGPDK